MEPAPAKEAVELRPWNDADWPILREWCEKIWWAVCDDDIPHGPPAFIAFMRLQNSINLGVYFEGELIGLMKCDPINSKVCQAHCIIKKSPWAWSAAEGALRKGIAFAWSLGYMKVVAMTYEHNSRMRDLIEAVGGRQEGFLEKQAYQNGEPVNMISYGIFKPEE